MFKRKQNKQPKIDTLIGAKTRINGDVEFSGGLHLDGHINGNVSGESAAACDAVGQRAGLHRGLGGRAAACVLNGIVKGDIEASERVELGAKARVLGNVHYTIIETAVGAQINGKLMHKAVRRGPAEARRTMTGRRR